MLLGLGADAVLDLFAEDLEPELHLLAADRRRDADLGAVDAQLFEADVEDRREEDVAKADEGLDLFAARLGSGRHRELGVFAVEQDVGEAIAELRERQTL